VGGERRLENFQPYKPYQTKMMLEARTCQTAPPLPLRSATCTAVWAETYTIPAVEMLQWHRLMHV